MNKYYNRKAAHLAVILIAGLYLSPQQSKAESPDDIVVFVNKNMNLNEVSINELKNIFLGKKKRWPNGDLIIPINAKDKSVIRTQFRQKVLGMTATDEATYWSNQRLRLQIQPPKELRSTTKAVFSLRNAIGYAFRRDVPKSSVVKIVLVVPN